jgi:hypothetical protein
MTSINTYDPASGAVPPELPPMSMACVAEGVTELLSEAADLPQPRYIAIFGNHQAVSVQFAPEQAGVQAVARWALRFGGVLVSIPIEDDGDPKVYHRVEFDYYDVAVTAYVMIPAATATT